LGLTGPSSGKVQLYTAKSGTLHTTEVRKVQYLPDLSTVNTFKTTGCSNYIFTCIHWRTCDNSTYRRWQKARTFGCIQLCTR